MVLLIERPRTSAAASVEPKPGRPRSAARRLAGVDAVRVLALLGVIVIHADHWPLQDSGADRLAWSEVDLVARVAVPLFVILSGFVMSYGGQDQVPWRAFVRRRMTRSLVPWLVWAPVYALVGLFITREVAPGWQGIGNWFSLGGGHLWFLVLIPQLYLLYRVWPRSARGTTIAAGLGLIVQTGLCVYRLYAPPTAPLNGMFLAYGFELCVFWIGYFAVGAALGARFASSRPRWPAWPFWIAIPPATLLLVGVGVPGAANADFAQGTGAFLHPLLPLLAAAVFLAVLLTAEPVLAAHRTLRAAVSLISRHSLGIYILHEALIYVPGRLLAGGLLQRHLPTSIAGLALLTLATLALATLLATLLARLIAGTALAATLGGTSRNRPEPA